MSSEPTLPTPSAATPAAPLLTLLAIIQKTTDFLAAKGVESARLNAELLIGHALGLKRMQLYLQFERVLIEAELEKVRPLVKRRSLREPLQFILGETEWSGLRLKVDRRALIPRHETELLIDLIRERLTTPPKRILDLGTGSGAIALALAKRYDVATVTAENAVVLALADRITFVRSNWYEALPSDQLYDLIVSNPPYLTAEETAAAEPEVRVHEPVAALISGGGGLDDLRLIISGATRFLKPGGWLALETGITHHGELARLLIEVGFIAVESRRDLTDRDRFVFARMPE
jgi:release factor glutamine methyltransferase